MRDSRRLPGRRQLRADLRAVTAYMLATTASASARRQVHDDAVVLVDSCELPDDRDLHVP